MGNQSNSHVFNDTGYRVIGILTDSNNRNTQIYIDPGEVKNIPTVSGAVTVTAQIEGKGKEGSCVYTDVADRSFIVRERNGKLEILRAKYGTVRQPDEGLRDRHN